ncbi:MAG: RNA chaperone Hfq [Thermoanaerobaculia bacterium]
MPPVRKPPAGGEPSDPPTSPLPGEFGQRKLIRPSLAEVRRDQGIARGPSSRKAVPPDQTNAEAYYYLKQMQSRTPIVIRLIDGEELRGWIEWYDKDVIKLNRENAPNLVVPKHSIKYLYKEEEERQFRRKRLRDTRGPGIGTEESGG